MRKEKCSQLSAEEGELLISMKRTVNHITATKQHQKVMRLAHEVVIEYRKEREIVFDIKKGTKLQAILERRESVCS